LIAAKRQPYMQNEIISVLSEGLAASPAGSAESNAPRQAQDRLAALNLTRMSGIMWTHKQEQGMKAWLLAAAILLVGFGCELPDSENTGTTGSDPTVLEADPVTTNTVVETDPVTTNAVSTNTVDADDVQWALIKWQGPSAEDATRVMNLEADIESNGNYVRFTYNKYPWNEYALGCFFVWDGSAWRGGKFDWIRTGGQSRKTLENIHDGYNGLDAPSSGTKCAFAWTDGKTRSNLAITTWP